MLHGHVVLENICKKLLGVRSSLSARSGSNMFFNLFPIFTIHFKSLQKSDVLHHRPSPILLLPFRLSSLAWLNALLTVSSVLFSERWLSWYRLWLILEFNILVEGTWVIMHWVFKWPRLCIKLFACWPFISLAAMILYFFINFLRAGYRLIQSFRIWANILIFRKVDISLHFLYLCKLNL